MKSTFSPIFMVLVFGMLSPLAEAHTFGAHGAGWIDGFAHPFLGLDHLLAMIAVGVWAAQLGRRATWLAPLAFVSVMAGGALLGSRGVGLPLLEPIIASSVLVLSLLVVFTVRLPILASVGLVGLFGFFHGFAHGFELPDTASPMLYFLGFLMATALLHACGLGFGLSSRGINWATRLGGSMIALGGLYLLATV